MDVRVGDILLMKKKAPLRRGGIHRHPQRHGF